MDLQELKSTHVVRFFGGFLATYLEQYAGQIGSFPRRCENNTILNVLPIGKMLEEL